ncbi:hypothetical protein D3C79_1061130 [compost metagenome]
MTLKQIKVAKVAEFVSVSVPVKKQTKPVSNKGRQQKKKTPSKTAKANKTKYTTPPKSATTKSSGWAELEGRK